MAQPEKAPTTTLYCSFCLKSQHEAQKLVAGAGGVYICDGCIDLCQVYIEGGTPERLGALFLKPWAPRTAQALESHELPWVFHPWWRNAPVHW
jgi:hypothetical protein